MGYACLVVFTVCFPSSPIKVAAHPKVLEFSREIKLSRKTKNGNSFCAFEDKKQIGSYEFV